MNSSFPVWGFKIEITKGSVFKYYWDHPFHATRISMRLGLISIVLSSISIILTFLFEIIK